MSCSDIFLNGNYFSKCYDNKDVWNVTYTCRFFCCPQIASNQAHPKLAVSLSINIRYSKILLNVRLNVILYM